jgi:hypothetical protein
MIYFDESTIDLQPPPFIIRGDIAIALYSQIQNKGFMQTFWPYEDQPFSYDWIRNMDDDIRGEIICLTL